MLDLGTVRPGSTIRIPFSTFDKDDGSAITMTNFAAADLLVYKDGSTTERASTAGFTATTDFDSKTGKHLAVLDLANNTTANFWQAGSEYLVALDAVTVDGVTVGAWIARFRIGYPGALFDTSIASLSSQTSFTLTAGPAEDDALNGMWAMIHDLASAVQCARVQILDYTGSTRTVTLAAGATFTAAANDNISIMGPAPLQAATTGRTAAVGTSGQVDANVTQFGGTNATTSAGRPEVNTTHAAGTAWGSGAITAASIASDAITAAKIATGAIDADAIASNAITAAKIASDAITAAKIADGAIDAATFAADVDAEILSYLVDDATRIDASALNTAAVTTIPAILVDTGTTLDGKLDTIDTNVDAILADTADIQPKIGTPAGASLAADVAAVKSDTAAILTDTAEIGAAGAGLTAVPWNAAWDAEVQSEVQDAIEANHLDHLLAATYDPASKPGAADALLNELVESDSGVSRFTANALEQAPSGGGGVADWTSDERTAIRSILGIPSSGTTPDDPTTGILDTIRDAVGVVDGVVDAILVDTAEIGAAGAGLTALATAAAATAIEADTQDIQSRLPSALVSGRMASDAVAISGSTTAADNVEANIGNLDAAVSTRLASASYSAPPAAADVADAVWDEPTIGHTTTGTFGRNLDGRVSVVGSDVLTNGALLAIIDAKIDTIDSIVDAITAKTVNLPADPADASDVAAAIAALNDLSAAEVNAEVVDALATDTYAEITGVPGYSVSLAVMVRRLYASLINPIDVTSTKKTFKNAAGTAQWEKDLSDDGTTYGESAGNAP